MSAAAIDIDTLNELFENQNKLDDVFNSMFDEDFFLSSSVSSNDQAIGSRDQKGNQDLYSSEDFSFNAEDKIFVQEKRSLINFILPVVAEIIIVSYCIMQLT